MIALLFLLNNESALLRSSLTQIPVSLLHSILTLLGVALLVSVIVFFFSGKLKRINRELKSKNIEIEKINRVLENKTNELTEQKEKIAREYSDSEKFFGMLIQSAVDGISFYDKDWNLDYSNSAFYSIIGYDRESYKLLNPESIIHPDDKGYHQNRKDSLSKTGLFESELRLKHRDGHWVTLSTRSVAVQNDRNETLGALTISHDITALKQVNEELELAKTEAETSNKLKASFLANVSHEIRTPLNSVIGFSNLLMGDNLTTDTRAEYIEHINHNSEKLLQIIGDIIDLSRLESSQIEITYEETSIPEVVNEIIDEARKSIKRNEKPIIISVRNQLEDNTELIFSDKVWLKRVLNHLMDNAVKFTLEGSVELSYRRENDDILFTIKDTGIGINKENLNRIFEEFRQEIIGHHRPFEGLGVGLTLAREVLNRMGGRIFVKSEKGIGSEFSFTIPYRPAGSNKLKNRTVHTPEPADWSSKMCLLVEDNKDVLLYLSRILSGTGIAIRTARSGTDAIILMKQTPEIDVVLLDMQMPEMSGTEVTREIRKIRKDVPIIAQTAWIYEDDKDIILAAGCDACLIKPVRKEQLLDILSGFIKKS